MSSKHRKKADPRIKQWGTTSTGLRVWLVDGPIIRRDYDIDFTEGGTHPRYSFIPEMEVWIELEETVKERQFVLLHELHERRLMCRGLGYEDAHQQSSIVEQNCRKNPGELKQALEVEGWVS